MHANFKNQNDKKESTLAYVGRLSLISIASFTGAFVGAELERQHGFIAHLEGAFNTLASKDAVNQGAEPFNHGPSTYPDARKNPQQTLRACQAHMRCSMAQ